MIVSCSNCGTKFNLDETLIPPLGKRVKCSKCKNIFNVMPPSTAPLPNDEEVFHLTQDDNSAPNINDIKNKFSLSDKDNIQEELEIISKKYKNSKQIPKKGKKSPPKFTFIITIAMLIMAILVGSIFIFLKTQNSTPPFKFAELKGQYYENNKYQKILVIQGKLQNNYETTYTNIELKASIFDSNGTKIREAKTFLGNIFNNDEILNLTPEYIQKFLFNNIILKPKTQNRFMIFFFDIPDNSFSFQVEILSFKKIKN